MTVYEYVAWHMARSGYTLVMRGDALIIGKPDASGR